MHGHQSMFKMLGPYILAGLSALGWFYTEFVHSDKDLRQKISDVSAQVDVLQSKQSDDRDTINEIKVTVRDLDDKFDQLLSRLK